MNDWLIGLIYLFGVLHAVPAWYFGKASGIGQARGIYRDAYNDWASTDEYEEGK